MINWTREARLGLRRHSSMILDNCRFPLWFIKLWCRTPKAWGSQIDALLRKLNDRVDFDDA
jgi:hypothetical protein